MLELQERLQTHLQEVIRDRDPYLATEGYFYVRQYIRDQFEQWGHVETQEFEVRGRIHQNLILSLPPAPQARSGQKPPILLAAHYDTVLGSPGADDNATGIAVLLELARLLTLQGARYPVYIVAFDLEEYGLVGSRAYAAKLKQQGQALRLMLSLEMLGYADKTPGSQRYPPGLQYIYPDRGDFIGLIGNLSSTFDLMRLTRSMRRSGTPCEWLPAGNRGLLVPDTRRSDHAPFWDLGYRAILVTDTGDLRNPHYHQASDRLETLDLTFLTGVCEGLAMGIRQL